MQLLQSTASRRLLAGNLKAGQDTVRVLSLAFCAEPASATAEPARGERAPLLWAESSRASALYRTSTQGCQKALALSMRKGCARPYWVARGQTAPSRQAYISQTTWFCAKKKPPKTTNQERTKMSPTSSSPAQIHGQHNPLFTAYQKPKKRPAQTNGLKEPVEAEDSSENCRKALQAIHAFPTRSKESLWTSSTTKCLLDKTSAEPNR